MLIIISNMEQIFPNEDLTLKQLNEARQQVLMGDPKRGSEMIMEIMKDEKRSPD